MCGGGELMRGGGGEFPFSPRHESTVCGGGELMRGGGGEFPFPPVMNQCRSSI